MRCRREFRGALVALGLSVSKQETDTLFAAFDADGGGLLDYRELQKVLRRGAGDDVQIAAQLQAGAMGEIAATSKNKISLRQVADAQACAHHVHIQHNMTWMT